MFFETLLRLSLPRAAVGLPPGFPRATPTLGLAVGLPLSPPRATVGLGLPPGFPRVTRMASPRGSPKGTLGAGLRLP